MLSIECWTKELEIWAMASLLSWKLGTLQQGTDTPLFFTTIYPHNGHFPQVKGQAGLKGLREQDKGMTMPLGVCLFLEPSTRVPLRDRAKAFCSILCTLCYTVRGFLRVQREMAICFVDIVNVRLVFWFENWCFSLFDVVGGLYWFLWKRRN